MFQLNIFLNVDFMAIKPQKGHEIGHISVCNFYPIVVTKKVSHSGVTKGPADPAVWGGGGGGGGGGGAILGGRQIAV